MKIYAGIGSRKTPNHILDSMTELATVLAGLGWLLRSGHADGADEAFEDGAGAKEIFLPWPGFNGPVGQPGHIVPSFTLVHQKIAAEHHPNWAACSQAARLLHMRNVCQILGADCDTPASMVVCWTPHGSGSGGTGQAIRIANHYRIPVFDLALDYQVANLVDFINGVEAGVGTVH